MSEEDTVELNVVYNVLFTEYYIYYEMISSYIPCWTDIQFSPSSLIIINSDEELEQHFTCSDTYPPIDFSNHTLLMASGSIFMHVYHITEKLRKTGENEYNFDINARLGWYQSPTLWGAAILIPKLSPNATVLLNVNVYEIPF